MIRDWWISIRFVCFMFQVSLLCDHPVSGNTLLFKSALQIFFICLTLVTSKNKAMSASFLQQKIRFTIAISFAILEQSGVILSQAVRARYIVICIKPTFTQIIDRTEKTKIPSKIRIQAARYNKFRYDRTSLYRKL